ncbi:MAG: 16S rRNA (guanine(966)-N(2))-methyltransferase RsmD, partial [Verrucomicrobiales bacterium]|nr:16S rRNA (guanine(966)-N(2))-methyltransferase RsmD [Verrucomicrobiales bacterium]
MRVIAGESGGVPLKVPKTVTRPTADRVREAVFSILAERVVGARVLDVFAGSGALGIEALSRGAESAVFVEQNRGACEVLRGNLEKTGLVGWAGVVCGDALKCVGKLGREFDLVFADPPYVKKPGDRDFGKALLGGRLE